MTNGDYSTHHIDELVVALAPHRLAHEVGALAEGGGPAAGSQGLRRLLFREECCCARAAALAFLERGAHKAATSKGASAGCAAPPSSPAGTPLRRRAAPHGQEGRRGAVHIERDRLRQRGEGIRQLDHLRGAPWCRQSGNWYCFAGSAAGPHGDQRRHLGSRPMAGSAPHAHQKGTLHSRPPVRPRTSYPPCGSGSGSRAPP